MQLGLRLLDLQLVEDIQLLLQKLLRQQIKPPIEFDLVRVLKQHW